MISQIDVPFFLSASLSLDFALSLTFFLPPPSLYTHILLPLACFGLWPFCITAPKNCSTNLFKPGTYSIVMNTTVYL